eukprot:124739-Amphidinium_carterae.1
MAKCLWALCVGASCGWGTLEPAKEFVAGCGVHLVTRARALSLLPLLCLQARFRLGWGTLRVAIGMGLTDQLGTRSKAARLTVLSNLLSGLPDARA